MSSDVSGYPPSYTTALMLKIQKHRRIVACFATNVLWRSNHNLTTIARLRLIMDLNPGNRVIQSMKCFPAASLAIKYGRYGANCVSATVGGTFNTPEPQKRTWWYDYVTLRFDPKISYRSLRLDCDCQRSNPSQNKRESPVCRREALTCK